MAKKIDKVQQYMKMVDLLVKNGSKNAKKARTEDINLLIEDILFEIEEIGKVTTKRLFSNIEKQYKLNDKQAIEVIKEFVEWAKDNKLTNESAIEPTITEDFDSGSPMLSVMKLLQKNEAFKEASANLLEVAQAQADIIGAKRGIEKELVQIDSIRIHTSK